VVPVSVALARPSRYQDDGRPQCYFPMLDVPLRCFSFFDHVETLLKWVLKTQVFFRVFQKKLKEKLQKSEF